MKPDSSKLIWHPEHLVWKPPFPQLPEQEIDAPGQDATPTTPKLREQIGRILEEGDPS
jgi:hypothetical protein